MIKIVRLLWWLPIIGGTIASAATSSADAATTFGIGTASCACWQSTEQNINQGDIWILGFWSGLNMDSPAHGDVGSTTDVYGIIGEVKKWCDTAPV
jgi:hypothetical protein